MSSNTAGYQSPLSTLSRSSKYRLPSASPSSTTTTTTTTTTNSGTSTTNHTSSSSISSSSRNSSPATHTLAGDKSADVLILDVDDDDLSDYLDDEPVTQAPQLSALARMLLSESSPKKSSPPTPGVTAARTQQGQAQYSSRPRQKLSWGVTSTEYIRKEETTDGGDSLQHNDEGSAYGGSYVTPAPRISRTIRPFTGASSYYTSSISGDGYGGGDATLGEGRDMGITATTHILPESAIRPQLGSAARWKSAGRGLMGGLAGAPRRGVIRRESSDQEEKESSRLDEVGSPEPDAGYGIRPISPGSPLQRASRQQQHEEDAGSSRRDRDRDGSEYGGVSKSRGSTGEVQQAAASSHRRESWSSRRMTPELVKPAPSPEPMEVDDYGDGDGDGDSHGGSGSGSGSAHHSPTPTPKPVEVAVAKPGFARFPRRMGSYSGSTAGAGRDRSPGAGQPASQGQDKENVPFPYYRRSVTAGTGTGSGKASTSTSTTHPPPTPPPPPRVPSPQANDDSDHHHHPRSSRSSTPQSKPHAPKMAPLTSRTRTPTPSPPPQRRDILATRDRNTPHRPAPPPPPPKLNMVPAVTAATTAAAGSSSRKRGQVIINGRQYRRLDAIGKGGSSKVYKVMAENFRVFAMKKVTFSDEEDGQAAILGYKGEIELLRRLEKVERVVRLFDFEVNDAKGYLIMLMECGEADLAKLLQSHYASETATFDISFTRHYWREMLLCVQAVHALNIIHSDLKPANFLVVQGRLKLIDFGIANAIVGDTVNVHRESQVGTINYMSPEALTDVNATPTGRAVQGVGPSRLMKLGAPSDVWSLGCILYQMVYGRAPFSHISSIYQKLAAIPNPRHEISYPDRGIGDAEVPWSVIHTLQDCLERDKAARVTIAELLSEENGFLFPEASRRRRGEVGVTEEMLRRVMENAVEFCVRSGGDPGREVVGGWARSVFGRLEGQEGKRRGKGKGGEKEGAAGAGEGPAGRSGSGTGSGGTGTGVAGVSRSGSRGGGARKS